ncbi:MAG TPA: hypothetical protein VGL77_18035, partial [Armatimonadota bacterium]
NIDLQVTTAPQPAHVTVSSARFPQALREVLCEQSRRLLRNALTFVKSGVAIDGRSGRAKAKHLRFIEMARKGAVLEATATIELPDDPQACDAVLSLLWAGAQMIERLGGHRRRGAGKCNMTVELSDGQSFPWLDKLQADATPPMPQRLAFSQGEVYGTQGTLDGEWRCMDVSITTEAPLLVPAATVGNVIETKDYLPGTYLLSTLTEAFSRMGFDVRKAITRGALLITNATVDIDGAAGRPTPFALFQQKMASANDDNNQLLNRLQAQASTDIQYKGLREGYIGQPMEEACYPFVKELPKSVEMHNAVDDKTQRPTSDIVGVYTFEAIPPGTHLHAQLRWRSGVLSEASATEIRERLSVALPMHIRLGAAHKDEYGLVSVALQEATAPPPRATGQENLLTVWLLSDLLLHDAQLHLTTDVEHLSRALAEELGVTMQLLEIQEAQEHQLPLFTRRRRTDSWHRGWKLPRPSLAGLSAGSCFIFSVVGEMPDETQLRQVELHGLGNRRAEGYGQVRLNDHLLAASSIRTVQYEPLTPIRPSSTLPSPSLYSPIYTFARTVEEAAWRKAIARASLLRSTEGLHHLLAIPKNIPMSQLGALRDVVSRVRKPEDAGLVLSWLWHLRANKQRSEKWQDGLKRIAALLGIPDTIWQQYSAELADTQVPMLCSQLAGMLQTENIWQMLQLSKTGLVLTDDGAAKLTASLWAEAVRTFIDTCVHTHKRSLEQDTHGQGGEADGASCA